MRRVLSVFLVSLVGCATTTTGQRTMTTPMLAGIGGQFAAVPAGSSQVGNAAGAVPSSLVSNNAGALVSNSAGSLVSNSAGALVSNQAAAFSGEARAFGSLIANSAGGLVANSAGSRRVLLAGDEVPLQRALIYLADTRERLWISPEDGKVLSATTDDVGRFGFAKAPASDALLVHAVLSGNRRLVGVLDTRRQEATVSLDVASTMVTEMMRAQALERGASASIATLDPGLVASRNLHALTRNGLLDGRLRMPQLEVGRIPDMVLRYLVDLATRMPDLKAAWENLLGEELQVVRTVGGQGPGFGGDGGPLAAARFNSPQDLLHRPDGSILVADMGNDRIRRIGSDGNVTTVAGGGRSADLLVGFALGLLKNEIGDGGPAVGAALQAPRSMAWDDENRRLFIVESGGRRLRMVTADGRITTVMGPDRGLVRTPGLLSADSPPTLGLPSFCLMESSSSLLVSDVLGNCVWRVSVPVEQPFSAWRADRFLGTFMPPVAEPPDGLPATQTPLVAPMGIRRDPAGNTYVASMVAHVVIKVDQEGRAYRFAGRYGADGVAGDGGAAREGKIGFPMALHWDIPRQRLLVGSSQTPRIRAISEDGAKLATLLGGGRDTADGLARNVQLTDVLGLHAEQDGGILFTDGTGGRIRRLEPPRDPVIP